MSKPLLSSNVVQKIIMLSIWGISSFSCSLPASAQRYRNCAELQERFTENNPGIMYQGFEKAEMRRERSMPFQSVYATAFFCNGGKYVRRYEDGIKRSCTGYLEYYVSPYSNDQGLNEQYSAGRGNYENRWIASKIEDHCHPVG